MDLYHIGLQRAQTHMKQQFVHDDKPRPERPESRRQRVPVTERTRLALGTALYRLANAIDPATPVPSRQH